jgi:hypothetical protein
LLLLLVGLNLLRGSDDRLVLGLLSCSTQNLSEISYGGKATTGNFMGSHIKDMWFSVLWENGSWVIWLQKSIHWQRAVFGEVVGWILQLGGEVLQLLFAFDLPIMLSSDGP